MFLVVCFSRDLATDKKNYRPHTGSEHETTSKQHREHSRGLV